MVRSPTIPRAVTTEADPILLLHGQPGSARDWERVIDAIGDRAVPIPIARPGWDRAGAPTDLRGNARAALATLDAHGIRRATVVGHSLGGTIAAWLAAEHPERVGGLALVAPAANLASLNRIDRLLATPLVGPMLSTAGLAGIGAALAIVPLRERIGADLGLGERYLRASGRALLSPFAWHSFAVEQRALIAELPALEARLAAISAPTTIVIGTADRIVPPSSARELATGIRGSKLVEIARASHLLPQQHPRRVAEVILDVVERALR